ncbi:MAG TPA: adenylate/guanylate cyclase domain-containing protein [Solirubrobacterales bacterium]|nr:adenylate/guanylate cyclase domain-containing protein [Solirubrobacterales bacterium]
MSKRGRLRIRLLLAVAAVAAGAGIAAYATEVLRQPELDTVDARFEIRGEQAPPDDVVIVGIDDITFSQLQEQWPFPRSMHAEVIDALRNDGARVIAYDVQFTEPTNPREDNALIRAVARSHGISHVVLATSEVGRGGRTNVFGGNAVVKRVGAQVANVNLIPDSGGVIRRAPYAEQGLKGFGVAAAEAPGDVEADPSEFDDDGAWIDYYGPRNTIEHVSFSRVLRGAFKPGTFTDKFVVVGPTSPSLQDVHPTSTSGDDLMSGPEIQASTISTVRRGLPLAPSPRGFDYGVIVLFGLLPPLATLALSPVRGLLLALAIGAAYAVGAQLAFDSGLIVPVVVPLATLAVAGFGTIGVHYVTAAIERQRVRDIFARFVPAQVVDQVLERTDEHLRLGGVETEGTILFSDIRGFTTFSESQPADRVLSILNRYLSGMTDAILDHGGTVTTYIGDGIMAVFGAPIPHADHADRALAAAREMLEVRLPEFNAWLSEQGIEPFQMGIGLNTGPVMAGNVGSEKRLEYTAIGDTVNTAARLEGMTKETSHQLFVAGSTRDRLVAADGLTYVDDLEIRGRREKVAVWSPAIERSRRPAADSASRVSDESGAQRRAR